MDPDKGDDTPADAGLADRLSVLARSLESETGVDATLTAIVQAAAQNIPGAEHASISAVEGRRRVETLAASGELPRSVDQAQYRTGEGPCLDALYEHRTVSLPRLAEDTRWPAFSSAVAELGVRSMLAVQLSVSADDLGALNLFSNADSAFDEESEHVALLFAVHAGVAFAAAKQQQHFDVAVSSRDLIGQAKGILMERFKLTADQAFLLLVQASQRGNVKLRDVCQRLAETGSLD